MGSINATARHLHAPKSLFCRELNLFGMVAHLPSLWCVDDGAAMHLGPVSRSHADSERIASPARGSIHEKENT
jgi:hypothetical protein